MFTLQGLDDDVWKEPATVPDTVSVLHKNSFSFIYLTLSLFCFHKGSINKLAAVIVSLQNRSNHKWIEGYERKEQRGSGRKDWEGEKSE